MIIIYLLGDHFDYMGNQVCCNQRGFNYELKQVEYQPQSRIDISQVTQVTPYSLTSQAQSTYNKLKEEHSHNVFLSLSSEAETNKELEAKSGFFKLTNINALYNGQWKGNRPEGRGRLVFQNGSLLIGIFKNNACNHKQCYFIFKDGSYYQGGISNNKLSGKGVLKSDKVQYEGFWEDGMPHGQGTETFANGDKFIGYFSHGKKHGNNCLFKWCNHQRYLEYSGAFTEGRFGGKGKLTLKNGTVIEGTFDANSIQNAVCVAQKLQCHGKIVSGKFQGKGEIKLFNSEKYEGDFKNNQLYGKCTHTDLKGRKNQCFIFKGRQLKQVQGLEDSQIQRILRVIEGAYKNVSIHNDALKKMNYDFNNEYDCRFIEPFQRSFDNKHFLIIQIHQQTILCKRNANN